MALVALDLCVLTLLVKREIARHLHFVAVVVAAHILLNVALLALKYQYFYTNTYGYAYWTCHTMLFGALLYMVQCLWKMGLAGYPGFHRLCLILVTATMLALLGFVGFIVSQSPGVTVSNNWINLWFFLISRSVHFVVAALLLAFFAFVSVFRVEVSRSVSNLAGTLLVYSITRALLHTWLYQHNNQGGDFYEWLWWLSIAVLLLSWSWIVGQYRQSEETPLVLALNTSREDLELRAQTVNRKLIRLLG